MGFIKKRSVLIILEIIEFLIQIVNSFASDIVVYEASEGMRFDFHALFSNVFFWIVLALQVAELIIHIYINHQQKSIDDEITQAYTKANTDIIYTIGDYTRKGDFVSAKNAIKILKKMERRRKKG